jgi:uncharacterized membrane protein
MVQNPKALRYLDNILIALHGFILILVIGHQFIELPTFLEVFGRTHPLLLHFPIVLLLLAAFLALAVKEKNEGLYKLQQLLLPLALVTTGLTVIAGLFLSAETGYDPENFQAHQWTGVAVFWIGSFWYWLPNTTNLVWKKIAAASTAILVLLSGHLGASLTHGEDFLTAPLMAKSNTQQVSLDEALAYEHVIKPILEQKCTSCHKASKQKGGLRLDGLSFMLAGGKNGAAIDLQDPQNSLMLQRMFLPIEDEEHMPPKGKSQLSDMEIQLIQSWLDASAPEKRVKELPSETQFFTLASNLFVTTEKIHDFEPASPSAIAKLNHEYRRVKTLYPESPALEVSYFGKSQFSSASLQELDKIKTQLVRLNLNQMPLAESDLKTIAGFGNLEQLNLNFTGITGENLKELVQLKKLRTLSLTGNPVSAANLRHLEGIKNLEELYLWNQNLEEKALIELKKALPNTKIETGYRDEGTAIPLNPPSMQYKSLLFQDELEVTLKHPIGSVSIFYTLDGSLPDSTNHQLYSGPITIKQNATLRTRAFASGWLGSAENSVAFLKSGIKPDKLKLVQLPADRYKGKGVETLFDLEKGDLDFGSGKWLGFQDHPAEIIMSFDKPQDIANIAFSLLTDEASYIFPPTQIEVWTKKAGKDWQLVSNEKFPIPTSASVKKMSLKEVSISDVNVEGIKAKISPIFPLPKWHQGAGQRGWVFLDEVVIN